MTIDMDNSQIFLKEDDVLSAPGSALMYQCTFKVSEFMTIMQSKLVEDNLFSEGMDCEVLSAGKAWTKGKLRMRLEFCPTESELKEQKALPAAMEASDTDENYGENTSEQTDTNDEPNVSDSTQISNNFPISRYPDSNPQSLGMWS
ncbi:KGK domain-containing protein [Microcoleus sp. F4-D5]